MKSAFLGHTTTKLHIFVTVHKNPLILHRNFEYNVHVNTDALNTVVVFYVTSATVFFRSISLIEISKLEKLYSPINMSAGTNLFINGKLDNSFLTSKILFSKF